jgi:hypothetical protein
MFIVDEWLPIRVNLVLDGVQFPVFADEGDEDLGGTNIAVHLTSP